MKNNKLYKFTLTSLMIALCFIGTNVLKFPIPTPAGMTKFHTGNLFCVLAALLIDGVSGGLAGAIGMSLADIIEPEYVIVAPKTFILKFLIGFITGFIAHNIFDINNKDGKQLKIATIVSVSTGMLFNIIAEPIFSYFYYNLLNNSTKASGYLAVAKWITTSTNAIIAIVLSSIIYIAIRNRYK